eukprot:CAMPEP_0198725034 /NCGR_PEP_ID=MMETSP1475-20131203/2401_1 /TAXON_ID= ORGANISM="Unidentified sp., Strain CCMP1999" /NCGR_SAMPLE_ID=MMETSP1475 /ASSEMBLY_ACC=CAM_ASM_001111 /LENGTH=533 /DNA_ID=CAMNT_0044486701 /DNA_START=441 /DNA_END=2038 /DNA_ORIENTATION=+
MLSAAHLADDAGPVMLDPDPAVARPKRAGLLTSSKSSPGMQQIVDDTAIDTRRPRKRNPGDAKSLALLGRMDPVGRTKVFVRKKIAGMFISWSTYTAEIRGCYALFYAFGNAPQFDDDRLSGLQAFLSFRGCTVERTKNASRGDILRISKGAEKFFIAFEYADVLDTWFEKVSEIGVQASVDVSDFTVVAPIGSGAGGKVFLVQKKGCEAKLAMKVVDKKSAVYIDRFHFQHAVDERILLELVVGHEYCVQMRYAFQTKDKLYYIMEFCEGGDIFGYMTNHIKPIGEAKAKVVAAQVLLALEHIHSVGYIYRDLKPENILVGKDGFVKVADFGLCKRMLRGVNYERTKTICGTFSYLAPEMLSGGYNASVDVWTFGVFLYELITGQTPCQARSVEDARRFFRRGCPVSFPEDSMSETAMNFLKQIICPDVGLRLGCSRDGIAELKEHEFFSEVTWDDLRQSSGKNPTLDVEYINREVHESADEVQLVRNFDTQDLASISFEDRPHFGRYGDWDLFPLVSWVEDGGDLDPHFLL